MDTRQKIIDFPNQFLWKPEIEHKKNINTKGIIAICGMGGSALAGEVMQKWLNRSTIIVHRDFHLPDIKPDVVIAISYSGNTEETESAARLALHKKIPLIVIASGGALEALSHEKELPFVKLPQDYQPREALGFMIKALACILVPDKVKELEVLAKLDAKKDKKHGEKISAALFGKIPLIYTSSPYKLFAYNWKIKFNETGKTPSFTGVIPELFHNEMTGFYMGEKTKKLANTFAFILIEDPEDSPEIKNRFRAFKEFIAAKKFIVLYEKSKGNTFLERFVRSINIVNWASYALAEASGADPENVPWVEEFKKLARED